MKFELDNGKIVNIPDKDIDNLQKSLKISRNEAILTWLSDNDYISDDTVEELSEKAKKNRITATVHQAKAENTKKERKPREKKENPLKKQIIDIIFQTLSDPQCGFDYVEVTNDEKYIDFSVNGLNFTVNLVQHRTKK